jgi:hypothetical protein
MDSGCILRGFMEVHEHAGVIRCISCPRVDRFGALCATTGWGRNPLWSPRSRPCSSFHGKGSSVMVPAWCGRVMTGLESPLEAVDSLVGWSSKAIHKAGVPRVRMRGQPPREVPLRMAGDHWWWKHTEVCPWGSWWGECASVRRGQLDDGIVGLVLQIVKVTQCWKWKDRCWGQCGVVVPFTRVVINVTGRPP